MKTRSLLAIGLVLALLALAGCSKDSGGGGSQTGTGANTTTVSPETYVAGLCSTMATYISDVQSITNDFTSSLTPTAPLADQKAAVLAYLDDVITSTKSMIADVQAVGVPDVSNGQEVVSAVQSAFQQAESVMEDARSTVGSLSLDDPVAFGNALKDLGTSLQTSLGDVGGSLGALDSPELSSASAAEPACTSLASAVGAS